MTKRPDDIRRGDPITAQFLNESKNAPPRTIRGGRGILVKAVGGSLVIEATNKNIQSPGPAPGYWAKITAHNGSGRYSATEQSPQPDGSLADKTNGRTTDYAFEKHGRKHVENGEIVWLRRGVLDSSDNQNYVFEGSNLGTMFAVDLTQTGGSAGDKSTQASWTYTAKSLSGETLGTGLTPKRQRPTVGKMQSGNGTVGLGYYDASGNFQLYDANEALDSAAC